MLAVGFVDLVGYTSRTAEMEPAELIDFVGEFRERTTEVVTRHGAQVVKHIGDEIMFSAMDPMTACHVASDLIDAFDATGASPRGGVTSGPVVARHGDLYGPVVNLASRLADAAVPGELLVPVSLVDDAGSIEADTDGDGGLRFVAAGRRQLKGFDRVVEVASVERT